MHTMNKKIILITVIISNIVTFSLIGAYKFIRNQIAFCNENKKTTEILKKIDTAIKKNPDNKKIYDEALKSIDYQKITDKSYEISELAKKLNISDKALIEIESYINNDINQQNAIVAIHALNKNPKTKELLSTLKKLMIQKREMFYGFSSVYSPVFQKTFNINFDEAAILSKHIREQSNSDKSNNCKK